MREKVGKSRNTVFFQWFLAPGGWKVGSLKRLVRSHLARWEMNNCTPLWRDYTTLHDTTRHYTQHTAHYTMPHHTTLNYITLHYPTPHCVTLRYIALHYPTFTTPPQMQLQLHYTNYTTPQLQLHYTTTTTTAALHHTTSSSCGWGDRPGDHCNHCNHSKKTQLQSPVGPSVDLLCHPWFTETNLSYRFPIFDTSATALCSTTDMYIYIYNNNFTILSLSISMYIYIYVCVHMIISLYVYNSQGLWFGFRQFPQQLQADTGQVAYL